MQEVWVLSWGLDYEGTCGCAIYATEEMAVKAKERAEKGECAWDYYQISKAEISGIYTPKPKPKPLTKVATGIVLHDGKYLIGKRKSDKFDGMWEFLGGKMEPTDRGPIEACIREVSEELWLPASDFTVVHCYKAFSLPEIGVKIYPTILKVKSLYGIDLKAHYEVKLVTFEELKKHENLMESTHHIIKLLEVVNFH